MKKRSSGPVSGGPDDERFESILGLGAHSLRKTHYPELRVRLAELERFRVLFEHGNDLILIAEFPQGRVVDANRPMREVLECAEPTGILADFVPAETAAAIAALGNDAPLRVETRLRLANGTTIPIEMTARRATVGGTRYVMLVCRDITERKRTEAEVRQARERAERANLAKSRFLAAASHDLRQPYQAMTLFKDVLASRLQDPFNRKILAALEEAMFGANDLLNALLDVSTLEAGVVKPKLADFAVDEILAPLAREAAHRPEGGRFHYVPSSLEVRSDATLLSRMVRNLLANACKHAAGCDILLGCRRRGDLVRIEVWDRGPGIPPDKIEEIFEEFTQIGNPQRDRALGLGLGLAIVARTGTLLDHPVGVQSQPGRGSIFHITVPVTTVPTAPRPSP